MRKTSLLAVVFLGMIVAGCGPSARDVQLEKAAKANWTRSLLVSTTEDATALAAWRSLCRACAPEPACSAEEQTIRADPRKPGVLEASLCESHEFDDYRSKPSFLR